MASKEIKNDSLDSPDFNEYDLKRFPTPEQVERFKKAKVNREEKKIILQCLMDGAIECGGNWYGPTEIPWKLLQSCDFDSLRKELSEQGWTVEYEEFDPCFGEAMHADIIKRVSVTPK